MKANAKKLKHSCTKMNANVKQAIAIRKKRRKGKALLEDEKYSVNNQAMEGILIKYLEKLYGDDA